jgi:hypothetical protein
VDFRLAAGIGTKALEEKKMMMERALKILTTAGMASLRLDHHRKHS